MGYQATPIALMKQAIKGDSDALDQLPSAWEMFLGNVTTGAGTIGEICALALLLGLVYMLWKKIITWHIPVSIIGTVFILSTLLWLSDGKTYADPFQVIFAGESMARNKYSYFASRAKKDGYQQIAALFEETAANEKEHAKLWLYMVVAE